MSKQTKENTFQFDTQPDRNLSGSYQAINISNVNVYQFMDEAYGGTGGFRDGTYLMPFSRESDYQGRKKLAYYKNYVKPILRAMVEPCFAEQAIRSVTDVSGTSSDNLFTRFLLNVDAGGTYIQDFMHTALKICRRHGVVFLVMDNYVEQPDNITTALNQRIYPYVYLKRANEVKSYEMDPYGNLTSITFVDKPCMIEGKKATVYRTWTTNDCIVQMDRGDGKLLISSTTHHNLGRVPVIVAYSDIREYTDDLLVDPPCYDIAKLNWVIFNMATELRDQERAQAFSIFYAQGLPESTFSTGPKTFINLPEGTSISPGYASPDFSIIKGLVENQDQIRKDIYTLAEQAGVIGVQSSESGIAKSYDFFAHEDTLRRTSSIAQDVELRIAELFKIYTQEDFVYNVVYKQDFAPMGLDREIDRIDKVMRMQNLNGKLANKLQEKLTRLLLSEEERSVVEDIIRDIQSTGSTSSISSNSIEDSSNMDSSMDNSNMDDGK